MDKQRDFIPAGATLCVLADGLSERELRGVFRATQQIDAFALREEYLQEHPDQRADYKLQDEQFLAWILAKGLLERIESYEWFIDGYAPTDWMYIEPH